ncbi:SDR family NAD(P)-dependent oxidoreductase [Sphingomonas bisphenolicum]|uniref:Oxidoreductase n=1 Tax=Sphingomonas bisphenolicum TaxID=296544 RepID=A0ABN5WHR0_9SPHN|nr:SDR family NAD(P)-dependent oxidoreductase [Sphingomonas bisphenolicum]BBF69800.1 oxidoreductase [Sphingomonas bisphenolicum]
MRFNGKTVLITGGGSGIGAATARKFADHGAQVAIADIDMGAAEAVAATMSGKASAVQVDVTDPASVNAMVQHVVDRFGRLDCAFNNAGIGGAHKTIFELDHDEWRRTIDVNLSSVFHCLKAEAEAMRDRGGAIVNTASVSGIIATPRGTEYCAAKHGVVGLTKSAALDLISHGIRVNAVCPGATDTRLLARAMGNTVLADHLKSMIPIGRIAHPDEIANLVLFLASDEASYVVGQCIAVDGGAIVQ